MEWSYFSIPVITGLIGWLTNVVAVKMLFHPRRPLRVFGIKVFQGVIPKRHDALARSLATLFEKELLSNHEIANHLRQMNLEKALDGLLTKGVREAVVGFKEQIPMASMFLTDSMVDKVASKLRLEFVKSLPAFQEKLSEEVLDSLDLKVLVEEKILAFSVPKLEAIIMTVASSELKTVEILGGFLGFIIGLSQVGLMILLPK
ncbi:MAG: DUF445 family protein [Verrucomicrobia bacterium]|nr:DUF445 family protein [Verrucomicrobiota bacterium]